MTPERFDAAIARLAEHVTYRRQLVDGRDALANQARLVGDPKLTRLSPPSCRCVVVFIGGW